MVSDGPSAVPRRHPAGIEGKEFEVAWANKVEGSLFGVPVFVISNQVLIDNKLATGRAIDRRDAKNLRKP